MATVRVDRDGKAKQGRRTLSFPLSLAGATVTLPDPETGNGPETDAEDA